MADRGAEHQWHGFNCPCGCCNGFCEHETDLGGEGTGGVEAASPSPPTLSRAEQTLIWNWRTQTWHHVETTANFITEEAGGG